MKDLEQVMESSLWTGILKPSTIEKRDEMTESQLETCQHTVQYTSDQGQPQRSEATYQQRYAVHYACNIEHNTGCKPYPRSLCSVNYLAMQCTPLAFSKKLH